MPSSSVAPSTSLTTWWNTPWAPWTGHILRPVLNLQFVDNHPHSNPVDCRLRIKVEQQRVRLTVVYGLTWLLQRKAPRSSWFSLMQSTDNYSFCAGPYTFRLSCRYICSTHTYIHIFTKINQCTTHDRICIREIIQRCLCTFMTRTK